MDDLFLVDGSLLVPRPEWRTDGNVSKDTVATQEIWDEGNVINSFKTSLKILCSLWIVLKRAHLQPMWDPTFLQGTWKMKSFSWDEKITCTLNVHIDLLLLMLKPEYFGKPRSIPWLLMFVTLRHHVIIIYVLGDLGQNCFRRWLVDWLALSEWTLRNKLQWNFKWNQNIYMHMKCCLHNGNHFVQGSMIIPQQWHLSQCKCPEINHVNVTHELHQKSKS